MSDPIDEVDRDSGEPGSQRVDKRAFIRQLAKEADIPLYVAAQAYEAFIKVLFDNVMAGNQVNLTGFGKFYWQRHIGHKVQFGAGEKPDYTVLKFSATRQSNDFLDLEANEVQNAKVPGTRVRGSQSVSEARAQDPER